MPVTEDLRCSDRGAPHLVRGFDSVGVLERQCSLASRLDGLSQFRDARAVGFGPYSRTGEASATRTAARTGETSATQISLRIVHG